MLRAGCGPLLTQVLTMEYCPGVKINNVEALDELGFDRQRLARLTVESYLLQVTTPDQPGLTTLDEAPISVGEGPSSYGIFGLCCFHWQRRAHLSPMHHNYCQV